MRAVQRVPSFRRERRKQNEAGSSNENEHGQRRLSDTFHPLIDKNLVIHTFNKFISHNDNAYDISTRDGDKMQALNAIFNFPSPSEDVKVRGTEEIPMEYKEHIGKNISVPNGNDGDNLIGKILGIKNLHINDLGNYPFYIVLFQADEATGLREALVKLIHPLKWGIKVLGLESQAYLEHIIKKGEEENAANAHSIQARILQLKAAYEEEEKRKRKGKGKGKSSAPVSVNFAREAMGNNYANSLIQPGIASQVDELEFARPTLSRSSSGSSSSSSSSSSSPKGLARSSPFGRAHSPQKRWLGRKGGKKTKKAKKTKKGKKIQKRKKTKRR